MHSAITRVERAAKAGGISIPEAEAILKAAYPELHARTHFVCPANIWLGIIERASSRKGPERDPEGKVMSAVWKPICDEFARMRQEYGEYDIHDIHPTKAA